MREESIMPVESKTHMAPVRLLTKHRGALYSYIHACVRNHSDAEDLMQDVSVVVVDSYSQLTCESGFLPWAREIARRRILAHQRKRRRELPLDPQVISALVDASDRVTQKQDFSHRREVLMDCLKKLPESGRELLAHYYGTVEVRIAEVAARFGKPVNAVYAEVHRMRTCLRDCASRRIQEDQ